MIIALTFAIIVPTVYLFYTYTRESNVQLVDSQINSIGREIINTAESIFYSGEHSKTILEFNMPENVDNVSIISERELVFDINTEFGNIEIVFFSDVNISSNSCSGNVCDLSSISSKGFQKIKIESINNGEKILIQKEIG